MAQALIIDAVRTPRSIGKAGKGALSGLHPQHLGAAVLKALKERNQLDTGAVDDVIWGTSGQMGHQSNDLGRMSALDAGFDVRASGVTLDRFCGSGITAASLAAAQVMSGMEDLVIAGGTEMMSYLSTAGQAQAAAGLKPSGAWGGNPRLSAKHPQSHQGLCADAVASMEGYTREELDAFGLESQQRAARAMQEGRFDRSVVPVSDDEGNLLLSVDEYPRPNTTAADLAALNPAFVKLADMPAEWPDRGEAFPRHRPAAT